LNCLKRHFGLGQVIEIKQAVGPILNCQLTPGSDCLPGNVRPRARWRDIRRLLIIGAMSVVHWAIRLSAPEGSWLRRMLARKPKLLVAIALANKMAREVWAMLAKGEAFRVPAVAAS